MVNINTNVSGTNAGRVGNRRSEEAPRRRPSDAPAEPAPRAHMNIIPAPETLRGLVDRAVSALGKGHYWDRGSILNLLL